MQHMKVSFQPFGDNARYLATIRRHGRRRRLLAVMIPVVVLVMVLQYVAPIAAAALLAIPCYLLFVVVPRWAEEDASPGPGRL
jgi:hypothetical protein